MDELTLITSYFNISRDNWHHFTRNDDKYLSYFKHWARLQNHLIIYTSPQMADAVMDIRKSFHLETRTTVIPIKEDIYSIQPKLYSAIKSTMQNKTSWRFHKKLDHPEAWNYNYNYLTGIKPYWVQDAIARKLTTGFSAWIDFGYDHGGEDFPASSDFDFLWCPQLEPLIHIALENPLDDLPIFEVVRSMKVYMRGNLIMAPDSLWPWFWKNSVESILSLAECGMADDDQTIELMAYRRRPDLFKTYLTSYWGELLWLSNQDRLHPAPKKKINQKSIDKRFKKWVKTHQEQWDIRRRKGRKIANKYFK